MQNKDQASKDRIEKLQRKNARIIDTRNNIEKTKIRSQLKAIQIMSNFVTCNLFL